MSQNNPDVADKIMAFLRTNNPVEARAIIEENPELLTDAALYVFARLIEAANAELDSYKVKVLEQRRAALLNCRLIGVEAAFSE